MKTSRCRVKTELFFCTNCGQRKRLDTAKQHWCDLCAGRKETEMKPARTRTFS